MQLHVDAIRTKSPEAVYRWNMACLEARRRMDTSLPPAPPVVWVAPAPELEGATVDAIRIDNGAVWVNGIAFKCGTGRRYDGRATSNGRIDYVRTMQAYEQWKVDCSATNEARKAQQADAFIAHDALVKVALQADNS